MYQNHKESNTIPSKKLVCNFLTEFMDWLFPALSGKKYETFEAYEAEYKSLRGKLTVVLDAFKQPLPASTPVLVDAFFNSFTTIYETLLDDAKAIYDGDPAAESVDEVIRTYPGFLALSVHRFANYFYKQNIPILPRILSEEAHAATGIDIHPGATIGERFCIDHGTGVVIGETTTIGKNVKVYQGVTLGALSVKKEYAQKKRHPTIEDNVVIYANATILGGKTVIGQGSIIGGNVWITASVEPKSTIFYKPEQSLQLDAK